MRGAKITCYHNNFVTETGQLFLTDSEVLHLVFVR